MATTSAITPRMTLQPDSAVDYQSETTQNNSGQDLYQQASQSRRPELMIKTQFEHKSQPKKTTLANQFVTAANREGLNQLAATSGGQRTLVVVYE